MSWRKWVGLQKRGKERAGRENRGGRRVTKLKVRAHTQVSVDHTWEDNDGRICLMEAD